MYTPEFVLGKYRKHIATMYITLISQSDGSKDFNSKIGGKKKLRS